MTAKKSATSSIVNERFTRRYLPHWQIAGAVYFLTWRCADGVVLVEKERDIVLNSIRFWDGKRWEVYAAVVMPDHVHALVRPLEKDEGRWNLSVLMHSVKSFSAHEILKLRKLSGIVGAIWMEEYYDRWMRDEQEIEEKWNYIQQNPCRAGLVPLPDEYQWLWYRTSDNPVSSQ